MVVALIVSIAGAVLLLVARPLFARREHWLMASPNGEPRIRNLLHRKDRLYSSIKELDFDFEMGKLSEEDHELMVSRLKRKAVEVLQDLEAAQQEIGFDDGLVEQEIRAARLRMREQLSHGLLCPECGHLNERDGKFCSDCGAQLTTRCPRCEGSVRADSRFCSHCGATLKES